jgi:hypothetical protein
MKEKILTEKVKKFCHKLEQEHKEYLSDMADVSISSLNEMLVLTDFTLNF